MPKRYLKCQSEDEVRRKTIISNVEEEKYHPRLPKPDPEHETQSRTLEFLTKLDRAPANSSELWPNMGSATQSRASVTITGDHRNDTKYRGFVYQVLFTVQYQV